MIDIDRINELRAFFAHLPRPLPLNLKLNGAETVTDPDIFIETQLCLLQQRKDAAYGEVVLARLLRWRELFEAAAIAE